MPTVRIAILALFMPGVVWAQCPELLPSSRATVPFLLRQLSNCSEEIPYATAESLASDSASAVAAVQAILPKLKDPLAQTRRGAAVSLTALRSYVTSAAVPDLLGALNDTEAVVRSSTLGLLAQLAPHDQRLLVPLQTLVRGDPSPRIRVRAAELLGDRRSVESIVALNEAAQGENGADWSVRRAALRALLRISPEQVLAHTRNTDPANRAAAIRVIRELTPEDRARLPLENESSLSVPCPPPVVAAWPPTHRVDPDFDVTRAVAQRRASRPTRVIIDEAHNNVITIANGGGCALVTLLSALGFDVEVNLKRFSPEALASADVVIISSTPGPAQSILAEARGLIEDSVFLRSEITALNQWVAAGGALIVAVGHDPYGAVISPLTGSFGVRFNTGVVSDSTNMFQRNAGAPGLVPRTAMQTTTFVASWANGLLQRHPITERVDSVVVYGGGSFVLPPGARPLIALGPGAIQLVRNQAGPPLPPQSVHAAALTYHEGRVVFLGDANAYLMASIGQSVAEKVGLGRRGTGNLAFLLNALDWLRER